MDKFLKNFAEVKEFFFEKFKMYQELSETSDEGMSRLVSGFLSVYSQKFGDQPTDATKMKNHISGFIQLLIDNNVRWE